MRFLCKVIAVLALGARTLGQQQIGCQSLPPLSGDTATAGGTCQTQTKSINGTAVSQSTAADQVLVTTSQGVASWPQMTACGDSAHALGYNVFSHSFFCQALAGGSGSSAWSALTSGTNSNSGNFVASGNRWDFSASAQFLLRSGSGATTSSNGDLAYDSRANIWNIWQNGANKFMPAASNVGTIGQPCLSNGDGSCTFADPIVSGPDNSGVAPTRNPVQVGFIGADGNVHRALSDNSGNLGVQFPSAQPITVNSLPLPSNAAQETGGNLAALAGGVAASVYQQNTKQWNGHTAAESGVNGAPAVGGFAAAGSNVSTDNNPISVSGSDYGGTPIKRLFKVDVNGNIYTQAVITSALPAGSAVIGAVTQSGTWNVNASQSGTWTVQPGNTQNTTPWLVTLSGSNSSVPATQSGGWSVAQSGNWINRVVGNAGGILDAVGQNASAPANWLQFGCQFNTSITTITSGNGSPCQMDNAGNMFVRLGVNPTIANTGFNVNNTPSVSQSGTWTVQPGNTPNTSPWLFTINQGGNSATVTSANALKTDASATTQPVSAASLPLPSGAATSANQTNAGQKTQVVDGSGNVIASTANALNVAANSAGVQTSPLATWTSGTALNTVATPVNNSFSFGTCSFSLVQTTTLTGGAVAFETSIDGTDWFAIGVIDAISGVALTSNIVAFQANTNRLLQIDETGYSFLRIRLSTMIAGTGTVTIASACQSSTSPSLTTVYQSPGNWLTQDAADMSGTVPGTAPSFTHIIGGIFNSSAPTPSTGQTLPLQINASGALKTDGSGVTQPVSLASLPSLAPGSAIIGKVDLDPTTPGSTNAVTMYQPARTTGTITTSSSSITANTTGMGSATVTVHGTYAGITINFKFSDDGGTTFYPLQCTRTDTNIQETGESLSANATEAWDCGVYGTTSIEVLSSAFTSGTANIGITTTAAPIEGAPTVSVAGTVSVSNSGTFAVQDSTVEGAISSSVMQSNTKNWAGTALGSPSNYGTSPGPVEVPGVNAFITNTPNVSGAPSTSSSNAYTTFHNGAVTTAQTVKSSAGNLYGFSITNPNSTACYLEVFNTTSPTLGTTSPIAVFGTAAGGPSTSNFAPGLIALSNFVTAISVAATTTDGGSTTCTTGMSVTIFYN